MTEIFKLEDCPRCIDERLVKVANVVGWLVCPNCDITVRQVEEKIEIVLPEGGQDV